MAPQLLMEEKLGEIIEHMLIKIWRQYNAWSHFVLRPLNQESGETELLRIKRLEDNIRPLFNLSLQVAVSRRKVDRDVLNDVIQRKVANHAFVVIGEGRGGEDLEKDANMAVKPDTLRLNYQSRLLWALTNLIEEDTVLPGFLCSSEPLRSRRTLAEIVYGGYKERYEQFQEGKFIPLTERATGYLSLKAGLGKAVDYIERKTQQPITGKEFLSQIKPLFKNDNGMLEAAVEGYKGRLRVHNIALALMPAEEELPSKKYQSINERLHTQLGLSRQASYNLSYQLYSLGAGQFDEEKMKEAVKDSYEDAYDSRLSLGALSKFFTAVAQKYDKYLFAPDSMELIFYELSQQEEAVLSRCRAKFAEERGPSINFKELYENPEYKKASDIYQGYELVRIFLAEKNRDGERSRSTMQIMIAPLDDPNVRRG